MDAVTIPLITITLVRTISFNIYTGTKEKLQARGWVANDSVKSTAASGFLGGAASGLLLSIGTTAFEFTKVSNFTFVVAIVKIDGAKVADDSSFLRSRRSNFVRHCDPPLLLHGRC